MLHLVPNVHRVGCESGLRRRRRFFRVVGLWGAAHEIESLPLEGDLDRDHASGRRRLSGRRTVKGEHAAVIVVIVFVVLLDEYLRWWESRASWGDGAVAVRLRRRRPDGGGSLRPRSERSKRGSFASSERRLWPRCRGSFHRVRVVFLGAARGNGECKGIVGDVLLCLVVWTPSRSGRLIAAEGCQGTAGRRRPRARLGGSISFENRQGEGEEIRDRVAVGRVVVRRTCHRNRCSPHPTSITRNLTVRAAVRAHSGMARCFTQSVRRVGAVRCRESATGAGT